MTLYLLEYIRIRKWFIAGSVFFTIVCMLISLTVNVLVHLNVFAFVAVILALVVPSRGINLGWRMTDLSMPVRRSGYARLMIGISWRIFIYLLLPSIIVTIYFLGWIYFWDIGFSVTFSFMMLGILTPCLGGGFHRGTLGWWLLFGIGFVAIAWLMLVGVLRWDYHNASYHLMILTLAATVIALFSTYIGSRYIAIKNELE